MTTKTKWPPAGTLLKDLENDKFGEFQTELNGSFWLRPVGGGHEWCVHPGRTRQATYAEVRRAREAVKEMRARAARIRAESAP
ncbi:hypothetical protein [Streptomyces griseoruber]|uniref:hypothetical protein n=1 Tax=Streptomyces griseoruber TaxID=1943 RepID=UPI00378C2301